MPCYPALALLLGSAMAMGGNWIRGGNRALSLIAASAAVACFAILIHVRHVPTPGDISNALVPHPEVNSLSLGHMEDLTLNSFAYLRLPLLVAALAFLAGALGNLWNGQRAFLSGALMMVVFFHAARLAMVVFDPYLSSRPLAETIRNGPEGVLITQGHYYPFSSVFFYLNRDGLLLNGRRLNLEYGADAPNTPAVFLDSGQLHDRWLTSKTYYLVAEEKAIEILETVVGEAKLNVLAVSGGKVALTNHPLSGTIPLSAYKIRAVPGPQAVPTGVRRKMLRKKQLEISAKDRKNR